MGTNFFKLIMRMRIRSAFKTERIPNIAKSNRVMMLSWNGRSLPGISLTGIHTKRPNVTTTKRTKAIRRVLVARVSFVACFKMFMDS